MGTGKTHLAKIMLSEVLRIGAGVSVTDFKADLVDGHAPGHDPARSGGRHAGDRPGRYGLADRDQSAGPAARRAAA